MIRTIRKLMALAVLLLPLLFLSVNLTSCKKDEGTAEKMGKKIDQAVEKAKEGAKDAKEKVGETVKEATK
ncbi:MAG: hypothetical protein JXK94_00615 [Deltaproteobacteria bacterium]|nr:hypothetical protein [Deltaproteobacteria bacterium]